MGAQFHDTYRSADPYAGFRYGLQAERDNAADAAADALSKAWCDGSDMLDMLDGFIVEVRNAALTGTATDQDATSAHEIAGVLKAAVAKVAELTGAARVAGGRGA